MDTSVSPPLPPPPPTTTPAAGIQQEQQLDALQPPVLRAVTPLPSDEAGALGVEELRRLTWFCEPCLLGFRARAKFEAHCEHHRLCPVPDCGFSASLGHHKAHVASEHALQKVAQPQTSIYQEEPAAAAGSPPPCLSETVAMQHNVWFCESCLLGFREQVQFAIHVAMHKGCILPGCDFIGVKWIVKTHVKLVHPLEYAALLPTQQKNPTRLVSSVAARLAAGGRASGGSRIGGVKPASVERADLQSMVPAQTAPHSDGSSQQAASGEESSSDNDSEAEDVHETSSMSSPSSCGNDDSESAGSDDDDGATSIDATLGNTKALSIALVARARDVGGDLNEVKALAPVALSPTTSGKVWYCVACDEEIIGAIGSKAHMSTHVSCLAPKCTFSASKAVVLQHFLKAHGQRSGSKQELQSSQARLNTGSDAQIWQRGCTPTERQAAVVPPDSYCCKICRTPGHWFLNCPGYIRFDSTPAMLRPSLAAQETTASRPSLTASVPSTSTSAAEPNASLDVESEETAPQGLSLTAPVPSAVERNGEPNAETTTSQWRCDTCAKSFPMVSQLKSHFADHVPCPAPGCGFSAPKRLVTSHLEVVHDQIHDSGSVPRPTISPRAAAASVPPSTYACKICQVPGHWLHECPRIPKSGAAQSDSVPQQKLPATYCCKTCGIPGHLIYNCSLKIRHCKATSSLKTTKQWRCGVCDIEVALESQLKAHLTQHVSCSELGCSFAASKRVVAKHTQEDHGHGQNLIIKETSDTSDGIVVQGRKYQLREVVLDGVKCNVLVDVGEA